MFESKGWFRTIGSGLASLGLLLKQVPDPRISVWGELVMEVGALIGGIGFARAIPAKTLFSLEKVQ